MSLINKFTFVLFFLLLYGCNSKNKLASDLVFAAIAEIKRDYTCPPYLETDSVFVTFTSELSEKDYLRPRNIEGRILTLNRMDIDQTQKENMINQLRSFSLKVDLLENRLMLKSLDNRYKSYLIISDIWHDKENYFFTVYRMKGSRAGCGGEFHFQSTASDLKLINYNSVQF